jgi:uncharacterized protein (DUF302 family)
MMETKVQDSKIRESIVALEGESSLPFDEAVARVRAALADEGFGVLTEIDIQATLLKKLGVERDPYVILGACHPPSAHKALEAAPAVGVFLPCNVTVSVEGGKTVVRAMNPQPVMEMLDNPALSEVGRDVRRALLRVVEEVTQ